MARGRTLALKVETDVTGAEKLDGLGGKLRTGAKVAGAALGAFAGASLLAGDAYKDAANTIAAGTGATGEALAGLEGDMRSIARRVPQDIGTVATVTADLNTLLGITGDELQTTGQRMLDFARVNRVDAADATGKLGRLMNDLKLPTSELPKLLDQLTYASQETGAGVLDLAGYVIDAGPAFDEMGFAFEKQIALFAQFSKTGARPEELIGSLNLALNKLADEGATDAEAAFGEYLRAIEAAPNILEATSIASELFGRRVGGKIAQDIQAGKLNVDEFAQAIADVGPVVEPLAGSMLTLGDRVKMGMNTFVTAVGPATQSLAGIGLAFGPLKAAVPALTAMLGSKGLVGALGGVASIGPKIGAAFHAMLGPIGLVTAAVSLLAAGFATDFLGMRTRLENDIADIGGAVNRFAMNFGDMGDVTEAAAGRVGIASGEMRDLVAEYMADTGVSVDVATERIERRLAGVPPALEGTRPAFDAYAARMEGLAGRIATSAGDAAGMAVDELGSIPSEAADAMLAEQYRLDDAATRMLHVLDRALDPAAERAQAVGFLTSSELARGLSSNIPFVRDEAIRLRDAALDTINRIDGMPAGTALARSFALGISANAWRAQSAAAGMAQVTRNVLPSSEPRDPRSPLRGITDAFGMMDTLADGITRTAPVVSRALARALPSPEFVAEGRVAGAALGELGAGGGRGAGGDGAGVTINVTAGVGDPVQIGAAVVDAIRAFERSSGTDWRGTLTRGAG